MTTDTGEVRPEVTPLGDTEKKRVSKQLSRRKATCPSCGSTRFDIGGAFYLGFLFRSEPLDAYMVALTCRNPKCATPRTAIRLSERDFLRDG